jgi:putative sigma-54 modulation protein
VKTSIKCHHMSITDALKDYAESKLSHIEKFYDHIESIAINLGVDHTSTDNHQHKASILVHVQGSFFQASESTGSMYASIDLMLDKICSQLKKYKDKLTSHRDDPRHLTTPKKNTQKRSISVEKNTKKGARFIKQPMDPEEAADILDRENIDILVFRDLGNEHINVMYRLSDKHNTFGLIEAK